MFTSKPQVKAVEMLNKSGKPVEEKQRHFEKYTISFPENSSNPESKKNEDHYVAKTAAGVNVEIKLSINLWVEEQYFKKMLTLDLGLLSKQDYIKQQTQLIISELDDYVKSLSINAILENPCESLTSHLERLLNYPHSNDGYRNNDTFACLGTSKMASNFIFGIFIQKISIADPELLRQIEDIKKKEQMNKIEHDSLEAEHEAQMQKLETLKVEHEAQKLKLEILEMQKKIRELEVQNKPSHDLQESKATSPLNVSNNTSPKLFSAV